MQPGTYRHTQLFEVVFNFYPQVSTTYTPGAGDSGFPLACDTRLASFLTLPAAFQIREFETNE